MSYVSDSLSTIDPHGLAAHSVVATAALTTLVDTNHLVAIGVSTVLGVASQIVIFFVKKLLSKLYGSKSNSKEND